MYFSMDVGGVVEFYPSRRIVTRPDIGDTIIRYGISRDPEFRYSSDLLKQGTIYRLAQVWASDSDDAFVES